MRKERAMGELWFDQWTEPTLSPAETLRCYLLHWWRHRWVSDSGIRIKHCPKCNNVLRVVADDEETDA